MKKNILITGGAGFIGSHLAEKLLAEDSRRVSVIDNFNDFYAPSVKRGNIANFVENPRFKLYENDIRDAPAVEKIFAENDFDAVVHLAAMAGVRPSLADPKLYAEVNINGTLNLLEAAKKNNLKQFVFGSSSSVYGENEKIPFAEDDRIQKPISPYAATKAAGELLCHTYSHLYDLRCVCLRFFTVYGARQRPDLAIHKFAKLISENQPIQMFGDGTTRRDYTFVDDIVQGICAAIDYAQSDYEIFNLGESQTIELKELIELLEKSLGKKALIEQHASQPGDVPVTYADISKAREILGYQPTTKIEQGIPKFVEWFIKTQKSA